MSYILSWSQRAISPPGGSISSRTSDWPGFSVEDIYFEITLCRAQKWMGRLYEAVNDKVKAVLHYER